MNKEKQLPKLKKKKDLRNKKCLTNNGLKKLKLIKKPRDKNSY
jgi:hypothetical protein